VVRLLLSEHEAGSVVLDTLKSMGGGVREARKERVAVVDAGQNERNNKFGGSISSEVFSDQTDATEMEVAGPGCGRDKVGHGQRRVEDNTKVLDRVGDWYGGVAEEKMEGWRELREFLASAY
jgi:hypothetical protein